MPCPFTGPKMFCAGPNILSQPPKKGLHLVPLQKLLSWRKNQFYWMQIIFLSGTKCLWLPQYVNKFLVWHKKIGLAQNILGPVKGQGISLKNLNILFWNLTFLTEFLFAQNSVRRASVLKQRCLWPALSGCLSTKGRHKKGLLQQIHANRMLPKQNTVRKERYDKKGLP